MTCAVSFFARHGLAFFAFAVTIAAAMALLWV